MTFSFETLVIISLLVLCAGGVLGALVGRNFLSQSKQKDLELKLLTTQQELQGYQQNVAKHFSETAHLINALTHVYKELHDHLSRGAMQLTNSEISKNMLNAGDPTLGIDAETATTDIELSPPKDWAPKAPGQKGTLSEDFGLEDTVDEETARINATIQQIYESNNSKRS